MGGTVANAVIVQVSERGTICLYRSAPVDLVADINWLSSSA